MEADAAVNTGRKIDPIPASTLGIFAWPHVDAGNRTGVYAVGNTFADIGDDGMRHGESLESLSQYMTGLNCAANLFDNTVFENNLNIHLFDEVIANGNVEEAIHLALDNFLGHLPTSHLGELLEPLVFLLKQLVFLLVDLATDVFDLSLGIGAEGFDVGALDFGDCALTLKFELLHLLIRLTENALELGHHFFFEAGGHDGLDRDCTLDTK